LNPALSQFLTVEKAIMEPAVIADKLNGVMIDETKRVLAEGVLKTPNEADLALLLGAGFPAARGGLMRYAKSIGKF
jgi:3-hydroxyacyl-CoA dehydrogenase